MVQQVFYTDGSGSRGNLDADLATMHRQLALNWEPGDEIFIFGFSRGAYTTRSLTGLIHRLGLLTAEAMGAGQFPDALKIDRQHK